MSYKRGTMWYAEVFVLDKETGRQVRIRRSAGKTEAEALALEAKLTARALAGATPASLAAGDPTLRDANKKAWETRWGGWPGDAGVRRVPGHVETDARRGEKDRYATWHRTQRLVSELPEKLEALDEAAVRAFVSTLKEEGLADATIRRYLSHLNVLLTNAVDAGWLSAVPGCVAKVKRGLSESDGRTRTLSSAESAAVLTYLHTHRKTKKGPELYAFFLLLSVTGCRVGEALKLRCGDLRDGFIVFRAPTTKAGKPKVLPATGESAELLQGMARGRALSERLFSITHQTVNRTWARIRKHLGITGDLEFVPHALRHTAATDIVREFPVPVAQKMLGHADIKTTMRYIHLTTGDILEAAESLSRKHTKSVP